MGLFSRKAPAAPSTPRISSPRTSYCIYNGEPFPVAGEKMTVAHQVVDFITDCATLPRDLTGLVELIRQRSGEPDERRVRVCLMSNLLSQFWHSFNKLGKAFNELPVADQGQAPMLKGVNEIDQYRRLPARDPRWAEYIDFELLVPASLLTSPLAVSTRSEGGWKPADFWPHDASIFYA